MSEKFTNHVWFLGFLVPFPHLLAARRFLSWLSQHHGTPPSAFEAPAGNVSTQQQLLSLGATTCKCGYMILLAIFLLKLGAHRSEVENNFSKTWGYGSVIHLATTFWLWGHEIQSAEHETPKMSSAKCPISMYQKLSCGIIIPGDETNFIMGTSETLRDQKARIWMNCGWVTSQKEGLNGDTSEVSRLCATQFGPTSQWPPNKKETAGALKTRPVVPA